MDLRDKKVSINNGNLDLAGIIGESPIKVNDSGSHRDNAHPLINVEHISTDNTKREEGGINLLR